MVITTGLGEISPLTPPPAASVPLLSCQMRIFQMFPRLVSVAIWKMSRALRAKDPLLSR